MKAKQKADELVNKARIALNINKYTYLRNPIWPDRCCAVALMAVDEILLTHKNRDLANNLPNWSTDYWQEVRKEIETL